VAESDSWRQLQPRAIREVAATLVGRIEQRPPAFSAKRLGGERAYALARAGGKPELPPRRIEIRRFELGELALPDVHFEIECSSGTYIRAVARDLGEGLGVGAHLAELRRIRVGEFGVEDALDVGDGTREWEIRESLLSATAAVAHLPRVNVDGRAGDELSHGRALTWEGSVIEGPVAVHVADGLVAIGTVRDGRLWPKKVFGASSG
jgi:tRNA pseudouridine55 synthase